MAAAIRIVAIGGWIVGMALLTTWSNTDAATTAAVIATFIVGVIVGRWALVGLAVVLGALLAALFALSDPDNFHDTTPLLWAAYVLVITAGVALLIALGVFVHRLVFPRVRRSGRH